MLFIIGLGLGDEKDISMKGYETIQKCDHIFLEHYTSVLSCDVQKLEQFYNKSITIAYREMVESQSDVILEHAMDHNVALLVVGDPFWFVIYGYISSFHILIGVCFSATTHTDMFLRAVELGVKVKTIHNASIMNAVGCCGLQLYNFGQTISIPLFQGDWKPASFYDKLKINVAGGLHTLCLLDIKVREPNIEILETRGKIVYDAPRYMTINEACEQLLYIEEKVRKEGILSRFDTRCVGMARVGQEDQLIVSGSLNDILEVDFGEPLHSLVIVGNVHPLEDEMLKFYSYDNNKDTLLKVLVERTTSFDSLDTDVLTKSV